MQTRKYPRTLNEAFGPYTDDRLQAMAEPKDPPHDWQDVVVVYGCAVVTLIMFAMILWGVLA